MRRKAAAVKKEADENTRAREELTNSLTKFGVMLALEELREHRELLP